MPLSEPLHYPVYYFRLAYEYYSDEQKRYLLQKNKNSYLSLAENLLKNGHIYEAWFYFFHINVIAPLKGRYKIFFEFTDTCRRGKKTIEQLEKVYKKYPNELTIPYCIFLLNNFKDGKLSEVEKVMNKMNPNNQKKFGLKILEIKIRRKKQTNNQKIKEDIHFLQSFQNRSQSPSIFRNLEQQQNYISAQSLRFELEGIDEQIEKTLQELRDTISMNYPKYKDIISKLFSAQFPEWRESKINQIFNKVNAALNKLLSSEDEDILIEIESSSTEQYLNSLFEQKKLRKIGPISDKKIDRLYQPLINKILNNIKVEEESIRDNPNYENFQDNIKPISELITKGKDILQSIFSIDEHYYQALYKKHKLEIQIAKFFHSLRIIHVLHDGKTIQEIERYTEYSKIKVFISYSTKDAQIMRNIKQRLESLGINVEVDEKSLRNFEAIEHQLIEIIENCDYLVVLLSPNSLKSEWVGLEILSVLNNNYKNKFIPLILKKEIIASKFRKEIREEIFKMWNDLRAKRNEEEEKHGKRPIDIVTKLDRVENLKNEFPQIYSEITEKLSLDFSTLAKIDENFPKLLSRLIASN